MTLLQSLPVVLENAFSVFCEQRRSHGIVMRPFINLIETGRFRDKVGRRSSDSRAQRYQWQAQKNDRTQQHHRRCLQPKGKKMGRNRDGEPAQPERIECTVEEGMSAFEC